MSKNERSGGKSRRFLQYSTLSLIVAGILGAAAPASAALSLRTESGRHAIYQTPITDVAHINKRTLDWRSPEVTVSFDIPDSDWIDDIELLVSARPSGDVSPRMPVMVSFNGAKSVPIYAQGQAFDARVKLSKAYIRPNRNTITFRYHSPAGYECLTEANGAWNLDFDNSSLVIKARAKTRSYQVREVEDRFDMPALAPRTVSLLAKGPQALKLQMLAAQGVGLRAETMPDFRVSKGRSDMEIIMGRRDELKGLVTDKEILGDNGARASLHKGRPMRLIMTGDTDADVLSLAEAFSQHYLPRTHRVRTNTSEIEMMPSFASKTVTVDKKTKLNAIPGLIIGEDWGRTAQSHTFNVKDPAVSSGRVLLRLSSSNHVSDDSTVQVKLNDESLGYTSLDRTRKSVMFNIPKGALQATGNTLEILPSLARKDSVEACGYSAALPAFVLGDGSKIEIKKNGSSPITELSRFAATGGPFSDNFGKDTLIVLASNAPNNKAAAFKVLAQLAKVTGQSWTKAQVASAGDMVIDSSDKNLLVLGPNTGSVNSLLEAGPKSLSAALRGEMLRSGSYQTASIERFASASETEVMQLYAARRDDRAKITRGGVAALYPSPDNPKRMVGVISASSGQSFERAADQLVQDNHWNQLGGSVTRWNKTEVLMAQTALPETQAMKLANLNTAEMPAMNTEWAARLMDNAANEARAVTQAASDKVANLRARFKDRFSRPLQAQAVMPEAVPQLRKSAAIPAPKIKPAIAPEPVIKVADASAAPALKLRGLSKVPAATRAKSGFEMPQFKMPELQAPSVDWTAVKAKFDHPVKSMKKAWTNLRRDRSSSSAWVQNARRKVKRFTNKGTGAGGKFMTWVNNTISFPALLVVIVFFIVLGMLGLSSANDRTGNYH